MIKMIFIDNYSFRCNKYNSLDLYTYLILIYNFINISFETYIKSKTGF